MSPIPEYLKNETRYNTRTLIGNWFEERQQFPKNSYSHLSSHQIDFGNPHRHGFSHPDTILRKKHSFREYAGEAYGNIINHHNRQKHEDLTTWYDEYYNKRERYAWDQLPELRQWDIGNLAWKPEKSDYPMQGPPINYGLHQQKIDKWRSQMEEMLSQETDRHATTYEKSFNRSIGQDSYPQRHRGTTKDMSSLLHLWNNIGHDAQYRNATNNYQKKQFPEYLKAVPLRAPQPLTDINVVHYQPEPSCLLPKRAQSFVADDPAPPPCLPTPPATAPLVAQR